MTNADTRPVRVGEEFDVDVVKNYLAAHIPDFGDEPLRVEQFSAGHSNLTYLLKCGAWEGVLRRPPLGPVPPKAHDMEREFRVLSAVHPQFSKTPRPIVYCGDTNVIGTPFYIMERIRGVTLNTDWPDNFPETREATAAVSEALVTTLAEIHSVNAEAPEVALLGRPEGYMKRQVEGWIDRHQKAKTDDSKDVEHLGRWLLEHLPVSPTPTLIHNDFKLNNVLFDTTDFRCVNGVVDWEMTTIGDPLSDLAIALSYWAEAGDPPDLQALSALTVRPGFMTRDEVIQVYAVKSGLDVANLGYYLVFAYFKNAGICQQIYYRRKRGQTDDPRFQVLGRIARVFLEMAEVQARIR